MMKKIEAIKFAKITMEDPTYASSVFRHREIKKWQTYKESYDGIKECGDGERACNMNNLLDEYEV